MIKLSIVIPTKNRHKYLKYIVDLFSSIKSDELELIIQDNSDDNVDFAKYINTITDTRVKYFYRSEHLTINKNSDYAILNSSGEYVCFMGDDDAFLPTILEAIEIMERNNAQAAVFSIPLYVWPDCKGTKWWTDYVPYRFKKYTSNITILNSIEEMIKVLKQGGYIMGNLPKVYHGIVKRSNLDIVYNDHQTFFPGPSPDMANAIALALQNITIARIDYPYLIGGTGKVRIVGNENGDNEKSFKKLFFLDPSTEKNWDSRIPKIWTGQTIYPETILKTLSACNSFKYEKYLNFYNFYIPFMKNHRKDASMVLDLLGFKEKIKLLYYFMKFASSRLINDLTAKSVNSSVKIVDEEIPDIIEYLNIVQTVNGPFSNEK